MNKIQRITQSDDLYQFEAVRIFGISELWNEEELKLGDTTRKGWCDLDYPREHYDDREESAPHIFYPEDYESETVGELLDGIESLIGHYETYDGHIYYATDQLFDRVAMETGEVCMMSAVIYAVKWDGEEVPLSIVH